MARQLLEVQVKTWLSLGKSIAQFLTAQHEVDYTILKWLTISKGGDEKEYSIYYNEVFAEEDEFDLVDFVPVDPDDAPHTAEFDTIEEALEFARASYNASPHKYVSESMISEEYVSYLQE